MREIREVPDLFKVAELLRVPQAGGRAWALLARPSPAVRLPWRTSRMCLWSTFSQAVWHSALCASRAMVGAACGQGLSPLPVRNPGCEGTPWPGTQKERGPTLVLGYG